MSGPMTLDALENIAARRATHILIHNEQLERGLARQGADLISLRRALKNVAIAGIERS